MPPPPPPPSAPEYLQFCTCTEASRRILFGVLAVKHLRLLNRLTAFVLRLQFMSGAAPPALREIGPYSFTVSKIRLHTTAPWFDVLARIRVRCLSPVTCWNRILSLQAHDVRYNINFTTNYTDVAYSHYTFQEFNKSDSCPTCTLEDSFVGINRSAH